MKKTFVTSAAVLMLFFVSCKEKENPNVAIYKAGNDAVYKALETGDMSKLDSVFAKDVVDHVSPDPAKKEIKGADSVIATLKMMQQQFTGGKFEVMNRTVDGDYSIERVRYTGKCAMDLGPGMMKGTNVDMVSVEIAKWKDGKITDHWSYMDMNDVSKMMQTTMPPPPADSTSKER